MYINPEERPYWDQFVDPFIKHVCAEGAPIPSKAGLTYALSRVVWAVFNRWCSATVASDLRHVLADVADEFKRRKSDAALDIQMQKNSDLPEGCWGAWGNTAPFKQNVDATNQQAQTATSPKPDNVLDLDNLPPGCVAVSFADIDKCLKENKSLQSLFYKEPDAKTIGLAKEMSKDIAKGKTEQKVEKLLTITDPSAEKDAEAAHLLAFKAYTMAVAHGASAETINKLAAKVSAATHRLSELYSRIDNSSN